MLGLLALEAGRVVPVARLVDGVCGEDPPAGTGNALQTLASRLRAAVPGAVRSDAGGYVLELTAEDVDVHRFTREIEAGRALLAAGESERAIACFDAALALWRGEPLIDVGESEVLRAAALRLTEQRLEAVELRADALRALGRGGEVLRELRTEVAVHPFRETLAARLVRALAAVGRTSEAIQQFQRTEALLREELGAPPAEVLRSALAEIHTNAIDPAVDGSAFETTRGSVGTGVAAASRTTGTSKVPVPLLPRRHTSFVGRGHDVAGVRRALREARLYWLLRGLHGDISERRREVLALLGDTPPPECTGAYLACRYAEELPAYFTNIWWGQIRENTGQFERLTRLALAEDRPPHPMFVLILALRDLLGDDDSLLTACTISHDPWLRGNALIARGFDELGGDHPARALPTLEAALTCLSAHGDARSHSRALISLASYRTRMLGLDSARPLIASALELLSADLGAGERMGVLLFAAEMYLVGGDTDSAAIYLDRAEMLITPHIVPAPARFLAATKAHLAHLRGDNDRAMELFRRMSEHPLPAAPPPAGRHDTVRFVNLVFVSTAHAATLVTAGRPDDALRELAMPRDLAAQTSAALLAEVGIGYALVALAKGAAGRAARILGATDRINRRAGVIRIGPFRRRALDQAEVALGPVRLGAEFLAGARLPDEAVLELLRTVR
ncbi:AfsR/SARP family transcriptional regulator [Nocardia niigatensis]